MIAFAYLAAIIHVAIFAMESILWTKPKVNKLFRMSPADAQVTKLLAFNQGFYNLFLALGVFLGLHLRTGEMFYSGGTAIAIFALGTMAAAGAVLICSGKHMWRGAMLQIIPSVLGIIALASA